MIGMLSCAELFSQVIFQDSQRIVQRLSVQAQILHVTHSDPISVLFSLLLASPHLPWAPGGSAGKESPPATQETWV